MRKRAVIFYAAMMLCMLYMLLNIFSVASGEDFAQTAQQQSSYQLTLAKTRGTIYDCRLNPLTGNRKKYVAAIVPTVEGSAALSQVLSQGELAKAYEQLTAGKPFVWELPQKINAQGISTFEISQRYADQQPAVHVLGYVDGSGAGASGIEKGFESFLSDCEGKLSVAFHVDALNHVLAGEQETISDTTYRSRAGVVLTLNADIQAIAEAAAQKYLTRGAVIVSEIPSCKIRAMVSMPVYNPNDVAAALTAENSPLLNRAMEPFSVGSVFKLVAACAALEYGISPDQTYICEGGIDVDGLTFHCSHGTAHGEETMREAIANSCNTYFVSLMQQVPPAQFLLMARSLGFGQSFELAPGLSSSPGVLPELKLLNLPRALANFSFGQGELTATPVQIAALVNTVASGGYFKTPSLYEGKVDSEKGWIEKAQQNQPTPAISGRTASFLRSFMEASIEEGTGRKGKPAAGSAGAKTSTAETGREGENQVISWFSGYYPKEDPQYVITVMAEGGDGGGATCGPVFKQIADRLFEQKMIQ